MPPCRTSRGQLAATGEGENGSSGDPDGDGRTDGGGEGAVVGSGADGGATTTDGAASTGLGGVDWHDDPRSAASDRAMRAFGTVGLGGGEERTA